MDERVAQLAAFVDRARRLSGNVAWDAAGKRELPEQLAHARVVLRDLGIELGVRAFEVGVGDGRGAAVARAKDVDGVEVALLDDAVGVGVDEVQPGCRSPMPEEPRLDVLEL